jgi:hypothetical protein
MKDFPIGTEMMGCSICDYDLCYICLFESVPAIKKDKENNKKDKEEKENITKDKEDNTRDKITMEPQLETSEDQITQLKNSKD